MAVAFQTGVGDTSSATNPSATSLTISKPSNVADGDLLLAVVISNTATGTVTTPSGWTAIAASTSVRRGGIYYKAVPTASAETPTSYTWSGFGAGRMVGTIGRVTGVDLGTIIGASATAETAGASGSVTLPAVSPTGLNNPLISVVYANPGSSNTDATYTYPAGFTQPSPYHVTVDTGTASTSISLGVKQLSSAGTTGTTVVSGVGVPNGGNATPGGWQFTLAPVQVPVAATGSASLTLSGSDLTPAPSGGSASLTLTTTADAAGPSSTSSGFLSLSASGGSGARTTTTASLALTGNGSASARVLLGTASLSLSGSPSTSVQRWLANRPNYIAHRGGSISWVEESADAYAKAYAWNSDMALEMSVWKCSTGEYVLSHDQNTSRMFGDSYNIPTTPWSTLSTLRTTVGSQPMALFTDMLDLYANSRIIVVDNKQDTNTAAFFDLLDSYGGNARFINKGIYGQTATQSAGRARGYLGWGYAYETDGLSTINSWIDSWDIIGLNYGAAQSAWNTFVAACQSAGKPYWPHILNTGASRATADTKVATAGGTSYGYMVSDVIDVVPNNSPHSTATLTFSASGSVASTSTIASGTANLSLTGTGLTDAPYGSGTYGDGVYGSTNFVSAAATGNIASLSLVGSSAPLPYGAGVASIALTGLATTTLGIAGSATIALSAGPSTAAGRVSSSGSITLTASSLPSVEGSAYAMLNLSGSGRALGTTTRRYVNVNGEARPVLRRYKTAEGMSTGTNFVIKKAMPAGSVIYSSNNYGTGVYSPAS
jgi:hypothetical protein